MAENDTPTSNGSAEAAAAQAQLNVQKIYLKDASFEAPNAPQVFQEQGQPRIDLNLSQKVQNFAENTYEVVLAVTVMRFLPRCMIPWLANALMKSGVEKGTKQVTAAAG